MSPLSPLLRRRQLGQRPARTYRYAKIRRNARLKPHHSGIGDHRPVVGTKLRTRIEHFAAAFCIISASFARSVRLALTPPAMTRRLKPVLSSARLHDHQRIHDRIFKSARDISASLFVAAITTNGVSGKGFQTGKLKSSPGRSVIGRGKTKRPAVPCDAIFDSIGPP